MNKKIKLITIIGWLIIIIIFLSGTSRVEAGSHCTGSDPSPQLNPYNVLDRHDGDRFDWIFKGLHRGCSFTPPDDCDPWGSLWGSMQKGGDIIAGGCFRYDKVLEVGETVICYGSGYDDNRGLILWNNKGEYANSTNGRLCWVDQAGDSCTDGANGCWDCGTRDTPGMVSPSIVEPGGTVVFTFSKVITPNYTFIRLYDNTEDPTGGTRVHYQGGEVYKKQSWGWDEYVRTDPQNINTTDKTLLHDCVRADSSSGGKQIYTYTCKAPTGQGTHSAVFGNRENCEIGVSYTVSNAPQCPVWDYKVQGPECDACTFSQLGSYTVEEGGSGNFSLSNITFNAVPVDSTDVSQVIFSTIPSPTYFSIESPVSPVMAPISLPLNGTIRGNSIGTGGNMKALVTMQGGDDCSCQAEVNVTQPNGWIQGLNGNVHSNAQISMEIPSYATNQCLVKDEGVPSSKDRIDLTDENGGTDVRARGPVPNPDWRVEPYSNITPPTYESFNKAGADSKDCDVDDLPRNTRPTFDDKVKIICDKGSGNLTVDWLTSGSYSGKHIIYVPGNLIINSSISGTGTQPMAGMTGLVFVVKGNVTIDKDVVRVAAMIIFGGKFDDGDSETALLIRGGLIGIGANPGLDATGFRRKPADATDNIKPMETIESIPKYFILFEKDLGEPDTIWEEVAG